MKRGLRLVPYAFLLTLIIGVVLGAARTAHADPHAIFYTAIGQQQLFFNTLAALDQADYVETQLDREELVARRAAVGTVPQLTAEQQELIAETNVRLPSASASEPGVSNLLARLITLEGNDLYTDYLVRSVGSEFGRRNATNELMLVLCQFALGQEGCERGPAANASPEEIAAWQAQRKAALVNDPLEWGVTPYTNGMLAAFSSGLPEDEAQRQQILNDRYEGVPLAYSPDIAIWRNQIAQTGSLQGVHNELLTNLLANQARAYLPGGFAYPYGRYAIDATGNVSMINQATGKPFSVDHQIAALQDALTAPLVANTIGTAAAERIEKQQILAEEEGLLADGRIAATGGVGGTTGELYALFDLPAAARVGQVHSLPVALAQLDTSQQFSAARGIDEPGDFPLLRPEDPASVLGIQSAGSAAPVESTGAEGQVAGIFDILLDLILDYFFDEPREATSPQANIVSGHLEVGAAHVLDAITNGEFSEIQAAAGGSGGITGP
jgi:hypothetical protein